MINSEQYKLIRKRSRKNTPVPELHISLPQKVRTYRFIHEVSHDRTFNENYRWLCDCLEISYINEPNIPNIKGISDYIIECAVNRRPPNVKQLYHKIISPKMSHHTWRSVADPFHGFVGTPDMEHSTNTLTIRTIAFHNVGMYAGDLEGPHIQKLVDDFYNLMYRNTLPETQLDSLPPQIIGLIFYLIYERIHPHCDGNGRLGRILFLENPFISSFMPVGVFSSKFHLKLLSDVFDCINFSYSFTAPFTNATEDFINAVKGIPIVFPRDEYYKMNITDKLYAMLERMVNIGNHYMYLKMSFDKNPDIDGDLAYDIMRTPFNEDSIKTLADAKCVPYDKLYRIISECEH